jgi:hypothetical protein
MEISGHFHAPRERAPGTHWIGGWVDPRAGLDAVAKRKIPSPCRESNPCRQARGLVAIPATNYVSYTQLSSYPMGIRVSFPTGKVAGVWSWPLTSF